MNNISIIECALNTINTHGIMETTFMHIEFVSLSRSMVMGSESIAPVFFLPSRSLSPQIQKDFYEFKHFYRRKTFIAFNSGERVSEESSMTKGRSGYY